MKKWLILCFFIPTFYTCLIGGSFRIDNSYKDIYFNYNGVVKNKLYVTTHNYQYQCDTILYYKSPETQKTFDIFKIDTYFSTKGETVEKALIDLEDGSVLEVLYSIKIFPCSPEFDCLLPDLGINHVCVHILEAKIDETTLDEGTTIIEIIINTVPNTGGIIQEQADRSKKIALELENSRIRTRATLHKYCKYQQFFKTLNWLHIGKKAELMSSCLNVLWIKDQCDAPILYIGFPFDGDPCMLDDQDAQRFEFLRAMHGLGIYD